MISHKPVVLRGIKRAQSVGRLAVINLFYRRSAREAPATAAAVECYE